MAAYDILTALADERQPYDVVPSFSHLKLALAKTFRIGRWPGKMQGDENVIDVFGPLADRGNPNPPIALHVVANQVKPVLAADDVPAWKLVFPSNTTPGRPGETYDIHKGLRIPYRYAAPFTNSTPPDGMAHSDIFILWTGHGGYP